MQSIVKVLGEMTYPSDYTEVPPGGLEIGKNVNADRESVLDIRKGFSTYKAISATGTDRGEALFEYKSTILSHDDQDKLAKDGADPLTQFSGTYEPPAHNDSYVPKIKGVEVNGSFYFTSNDGIKKLESLTATPRDAGVPRGLEMALTLGSTGSGFMADDTRVAYRHVWGYRDENDVLVIGAPGNRVTVGNSSGNSQDVGIEFTIPSGITTEYFYQVYRSEQSSGSAVEPSDELQLVAENNPTATDITNGYVSFTDSTDDDLRGAALYTNSSQQGINQSNDPPPSAKDVGVFKSHSIYANTIQKQNRTITLLAAGGDSGLNYRTPTGDTTDTSDQVTNISDTTGLAIGQKIEGVGIPADTVITNIVGSTLTISNDATVTDTTVALECYDYLTIDGVEYNAAAALSVGDDEFEVSTGGTVSQNIADTALSLVKLINRSASNTTINAYYTSGADDLPGRIYLESRDFGDSAWAVLASSHGSGFNPVLPTSGTDIISTADARRNRIHVSKPDQPESVPLLQYFDVGARDKAILRVFTLRESFIILKEDGVFRMTGTAVSNFNIDPLDSTVILIAPETARVLNNQIYCLSNQGVAVIDDTSVGIISRDIEDQVNDLLKTSNIRTVSFAVSHESRRKYLLCVPTDSSDTYAKKIHVYNHITKKWTHWEKEVRTGLVKQDDDTLYFAQGDGVNIIQQRNTGDYTDYADEDLAVTVSSVSDDVVTLASVAGIEVGDVLVQGSLPHSIVTAIDTDNTTVTVHVERSYTAAAATIKKSYPVQIRWNELQLGNPGILKHVRECKPLFKANLFDTAEMRFTSDLNLGEESVSITGIFSLLWGFFPWGEAPWGGVTGAEKSRLWVSAEHQRCGWIKPEFYLRQAYADVQIAGLHMTYENMDVRTEGTA